ncbi:MAG: glutamine--fructose-6-phosphate transaminase (isomerizing), partial [Gammaproteobacteria bacterium]|nr:glutamine--fructose-6-phosphate transaminase (isomerizing) [Gammaproteobacteria bacterium]NNM12935.1 glutamine--fructose-6-phosphate transaminase (isomerizing) [Gammaproteobacteria bacterium]
MCGIVGAIAERNVVPILMEGLRRLEYRGYDSAGVAVLNLDNKLERQRAKGKVQALQDILDTEPLLGHIGIAHTRWATHGVPSVRNAHPHFSETNVGLVHNGIIENYEHIKHDLQQQGVKFHSETDTEVVAHRVHEYLLKEKDLFRAVRATVNELIGAYALVVTSPEDPEQLVVARAGCPVVIGLGIGENFVASDVAALLPVTRSFKFLEEGDIAVITRTQVKIFDKNGNTAERPTRESELTADSMDKGAYRHFMLKEIHEQPFSVTNTLEERIHNGRVFANIFGHEAEGIFKQTQQVKIVACGTSFHAGLVAQYLIESIAKIPCSVEIASEFRYRKPVVTPNTLFVTISQSGETLDTMEALKMAKQMGYLASLGICNVPESALVRESDLVLMTRAGPEIGVASTKAFTTQLAGLSLLTLCLAKVQGMSEEQEAKHVHSLMALPRLIEHAMELDGPIKALSERFADKHHALFLGRGAMYPVAMEGALKLKEISYIHAEAYPAG